MDRPAGLAEPTGATDVGPRFTERRRLPRALSLAINIPMGAFVLGLLFLLAHPDVDNVGVWLLLVACFGVVPLLIISFHSRVTVDEKYLTLALVPVWRKRLPLVDITEVRERTVYAREIGGLGLRRTGDGTIALVMRGTSAIEVVTRDGKRYIVATDHPKTLTATLLTP